MTVGQSTQTPSTVASAVPSTSGLPPFNRHPTKASYSFVCHPEDCNGLVRRRSSTSTQPNLRPPRDDPGVRSVVYRSFKNESCSIHGTQLHFYLKIATRRSQRLCGLRRRSTAARLLGLWVRIPPAAWTFVCCEYCVLLSGRRLYDGLATRPDESYRLWCVVVCDMETSRMRTQNEQAEPLGNASSKST